MPLTPGMSTDQSANRTDGETIGQDQEPREAGQSDATQREQEQREGQAPIADPTAQDADREDSLARSPDATYGQAEGQAGTSSAGMPDSDMQNEGSST
ncbi:MAG TPA: hypothetical protein VH987_03625 [Candidatus Limnocylindria bacterium]|jgi:hypothetical protein